MNIDLTKVCDLEFGGVDHKDCPDYCDAYIAVAWIEDNSYGTVQNKKSGNWYRELTEDELNWLQENEPDWVFAQLEKSLY